MRPEDILATYERVGPIWAQQRDGTLFERRWLDRMLAHAPGRRVLDLGCGSGVPIARYLAARRARVTGVDGAAAMVELFAANLPGAEAIHADMRRLDLGRSFDAIVAWDSFFHLGMADQRAMFEIFAAHAASRAVLLFTTGTGAGEAIGAVAGAPVYHASLDPAEYESLLDGSGFEVVSHMAEDPDCAGHTVWLARSRA